MLVMYNPIASNLFHLEKYLPRYLKITFLWQHICVILPLHQITKKKKKKSYCCCEGVSNTAAVGVTVNLTSVSLLTAIISLFFFFLSLIIIVKTLFWRFYSAVWSIRNAKCI